MRKTSSLVICLLIYLNCSIAGELNEVSCQIVNDPCAPLRILAAKLVLSEDNEEILRYSAEIENVSLGSILAYGLVWTVTTDTRSFSVYTDVDLRLRGDRSKVLQPGGSQTDESRAGALGVVSIPFPTEKYKSVSVRLDYALGEEGRLFTPDNERHERVRRMQFRYSAVAYEKRDFLDEYRDRGGIQALIRFIVNAEDRIDTPNQRVQQSVEQLEKLGRRVFQIGIGPDSTMALGLKEILSDFRKQLLATYQNGGERALIKMLEYEAEGRSRTEFMTCISHSR